MGIGKMEVDEGNDNERTGSQHTDFEDDFATTIALLEMGADEIEVEVHTQRSKQLILVFYHFTTAYPLPILYFNVRL